MAHKFTARKQPSGFGNSDNIKVVDCPVASGYTAFGMHYLHIRQICNVIWGIFLFFITASVDGILNDRNNDLCAQSCGDSNFSLAIGAKVMEVVKQAYIDSLCVRLINSIQNTLSKGSAISPFISLPILPERAYTEPAKAKNGIHDEKHI